MAMSIARFEQPVERAFQRLFAQADKANSAILEKIDRTAEVLADVIDDQEPDSELIAEFPQPRCAGHGVWHLQGDYLGGSGFFDQAGQVACGADHWPWKFARTFRLIADDAGDIDAVTGFALNPVRASGWPASESRSKACVPSGLRGRARWRETSGTSDSAAKVEDRGPGMNEKRKSRETEVSFCATRKSRKMPRIVITWRSESRITPSRSSWRRSVSCSLDTTRSRPSAAVITQV